MVDIKAELYSTHYDDDGNMYVTFKVNNSFKKEAQQYKDKPLKIHIAEYRKHRSLNANAYAWVLIDKLATVLNLKKEDIYKSYIRNIGGISTMVLVSADKVDKFRRDWSSNGLGWQTDVLPAKTRGYVKVICYEGSSEFDVYQMSRLIDLIQQDCIAQGIEIKTPDELLRMGLLIDDNK